MVHAREPSQARSCSHTQILVAMAATLLLLAANALIGRPSAASDDPTLNERYDSVQVQVRGDYQPLVGDFDCDGREREIIWYAPGPARDYYWQIHDTPGDSYDITSSRLPDVNGTYEPFVVTYDENSICPDDIFWYAPGPARDYIWDVKGPGGFVHSSVPTTVNGDYIPVVTEVGTGATGEANGIYWYRPGRGTDHAWTLDGMGGITRWTPPQVNGTYEPTTARGDSGHLGILWYAPGTATDHFWRGLQPGDATPDVDVEVTINGDYEAHPNVPDTLLYGPGSGPDFAIIDIAEGTGELTTIAATVNGDYRVGTGLHDHLIVWHRPGSGTDHIWLRD